MKHKPCDMALINKIYPDFTICEVLRKIYRLTDDEEIHTLCRIGVTMGKAMSQKLESLKAEWQEGFWDKA